MDAAGVHFSQSIEQKILVLSTRRPQLSALKQPLNPLFPKIGETRYKTDRSRPEKLGTR